MAYHIGPAVSAYNVGQVVGALNQPCGNVSEGNLVDLLDRYQKPEQYEPNQDNYCTGRCCGGCA